MKTLQQVINTTDHKLPALRPRANKKGQLRIPGERKHDVPVKFLQYLQLMGEVDHVYMFRDQWEDMHSARYNRAAWNDLLHYTRINNIEIRVVEREHVLTSFEKTLIKHPAGLVIDQ